MAALCQMAGSFKLLRNQAPVPGQNCIRLGHLRDVFQRFASKRLAISANVTRSGSASRCRIVRWPPRIRFSAIRVLGAFLLYSHAADSHVAASLQRELQTIAKPWYRCEASEYFGMRQIYPPLLGFGRP